MADATDLAWCYVIYLRTVTTDGSIHVAFVCGNSKVLPKGVSVKGELSIPRTELNAAVDLAEQVLQVETELDIPNLHPTQYYTDSMNVLSWFTSNNDTNKRYFVSRISTIRKLTEPLQWQYIPTAENPADIRMRPITFDKLKDSVWLKGPAFLHEQVVITPIKHKQSTTSTNPFIAPLNSYFIKNRRYSTEEFSTSATWKKRPEMFQKENNL